MINIKEILKNYVDCFGRVTLQHNSKSSPEKEKFDSENQHLWTGEVALLLDQLHLEDMPVFKKSVEYSLFMTKILPGLHARHPNIDGKIEGDYHGISHDEHCGIMFSSSVLRDTQTPLDVILYGECHNWIFIDEKPGADLYKTNLKYKDRIRQPRDREFYRICAKIFPKFVGFMSILISSIISSYRPKEETSGKIISFFRFLTIQYYHFDILPKVYRLLFKMFYMWYERNLRKQYGKYYLSKIIGIYFATNIEHPIHELAKEYENRFF